MSYPAPGEIDLPCQSVLLTFLLIRFPLSLLNGEEKGPPLGVWQGLKTKKIPSPAMRLVPEPTFTLQGVQSGDTTLSLPVAIMYASEPHWPHW